MPKTDEAPSSYANRPIALQVVIAAVALLVAWHASLLAWVSVSVLISAIIARRVTQAWWDARKRQFGREIEARSLKDLSRLCRMAGVPFQSNVPVVGLGDADAIMGRTPVVVEVKSWRRWSLADGRCLDAVRQVERLLPRCQAERGLIWLPQGELTLLQKLGFQPGMPRNIRVVAGPAWRPLWRVIFR